MPQNPHQRLDSFADQLEGVAHNIRNFQDADALLALRAELRKMPDELMEIITEMLQD